MVALNKDLYSDVEWSQKDIYGDYDRKHDGKLDALYRSIEASYRGLEPFRNLNRKLIREYAGPAYGECEQKRKYLNMTAQLVDAYTMLLAANRPKAEVTTKFQSLQPYARHYSVGLNNLITEIGLEHTIRRWVLDAFFNVGVIKLHQKDAGEIQFEKNLWMDPGTPFASNVSLDNFVYDMGARTWGEVRWAGDMYRVPLEDIQHGAEIGMYDPEVAAEITPTSKYHIDKELVAEFSKGNETDLDDFQPMVDLADIWVAREHKIYTFVVAHRNKFCIKSKPLAVMDWNDPECGPYHLLGFSDVPDNIMPIGPAVHMDEMDRLINNIMRKQARQAMRQKDGMIYSAQGSETAKRWQKSPDGGMFQGDPTGMQRVSEGGANPVNQQFLLNILELYNRQSGNLDSMLGLGAQAETVGQEQLIHDAGNRKIGAMQARVLDATRRMLKSLAFMLWEDEFKEIAGQIETDAGYLVDANWKAGDREGNFLDYNFDVNVFSMAYRPPAQQAESLMGIIKNVVVPLMPNLMQQGGAINVAALMNELSDKLDMPVLKDVIQFNMPPMMEQGKPETSIKPASTTRTYERTSRAGGPTGPGKMAQMAQNWSTMGSQQAMPTGGGQP
jgi:hypothetical protein